MSGLASLGPDAIGPLVEFVARLKHDLGKYVCFQTRWVGPDASEAERLEALRADLLQTRRGPSGTVDALQVWDEFRAVLLGEAPVPGGGVHDLSQIDEVARLVTAMDQLRPVVASLRAGTAGADALGQGTQAAGEVSAACRDLQRRVRRVATEP